jgi:hypothetical protein
MKILTTPLNSHPTIPIFPNSAAHPKIMSSNHNEWFDEIHHLSRSKTQNLQWPTGEEAGKMLLSLKTNWVI